MQARRSTVCTSMWDAPSNVGRPPITSTTTCSTAKVAAEASNLGAHDSTGHEHDHHGPEREQVGTKCQVKAWRTMLRMPRASGRLSGRGSPDADPANNLPVYTGGVRNFTVEENTGAGVNIGTPVDCHGLRPTTI